MTEPEPEDDEGEEADPDDGPPLVVARVTIERTLWASGHDLVTVDALDGAGEDDLRLVEALGLLRMAEDTLIRRGMGEDV